MWEGIGHIGGVAVPALGAPDVQDSAGRVGNGVENRVLGVVVVESPRQLRREPLRSIVLGVGDLRAVVQLAGYT